MVTDFGLAKDVFSKYSHQTTTTQAVGRAWFTDPTQLFALKDGNFRTDMFSLAKTIDYIMDGKTCQGHHISIHLLYIKLLHLTQIVDTRILTKCMKI